MKVAWSLYIKTPSTQPTMSDTEGQGNRILLVAIHSNKSIYFDNPEKVHTFKNIYTDLSLYCCLDKKIIVICVDSRGNIGDDMNYRIK